MNQQEFQRKLAAAQALSLTVTETFTKVGRDYFQQFEIKKDAKVVESQTFPIERDKLLTTLEEAKTAHSNAVVEIQKKIDDIKALK